MKGGNKCDTDNLNYFIVVDKLTRPPLSFIDMCQEEQMTCDTEHTSICFVHPNPVYIYCSTIVLAKQDETLEYYKYQ